MKKRKKKKEKKEKLIKKNTFILFPLSYGDGLGGGKEE